MRRGILLRLLWRELRSGVQGFRIFLACLTLGVAAIAASGTLTTAMRAAIDADSRAILGGDLEISQTYRPLEEEQIRFFESMGTLSHLVTLRAMAYPEDRDKGRTLVDLKALDGPYPLYGDFLLEPPLTRAQALAQKDGRWGVAVDRTLLAKLGLTVGDILTVGEAHFIIRATIAKEPDSGVEIMRFGPRVIIEKAALEETGLAVPGALIRHAYLLKVPEHAGVSGLARDAQLTDTVRKTFPDAAWQIRDPGDASPGVRRFLDVLASFLTIVGLSTLTIGGIGVAGAVRGFIESRASSIAAMKCLGMSEEMVFALYTLHMTVLALIGTIMGLLLGGGGSVAALALLDGHLPLAVVIRFYPAPLGIAAVFGLASAAVFSLAPLLRVRLIPATSLFRSPGALLSVSLPWRALVVVGIAIAVLCGLVVLVVGERVVALAFVGGALAALLVFRGTAFLLMTGTRFLLTLPLFRTRPAWRLALGNLSRPGSPAVSMIVSMGLGLTVLVAIVQIEASLSRYIEEQLPHEAPAFFFLDLQRTQENDFRTIVREIDPEASVVTAPMIRGRIVRMNGVPVSQLTNVPESMRWTIGSDRGLTMAASPPPGSKISAGEWWPVDYAGEPLLSLDANIARGFGLKLGDTITLSILGREMTVRIASLREIDWTSLNMNFTFVLSPGALGGAPYTILATVRLPEEKEIALEKAVTDRLSNVSAIPIRNALTIVRGIIVETAKVISAAAGLTLLTGVLVLAGAVAAEQRRRIYETVVFKVLGASNRLLWRSFLLEFGLLGMASGGVAVVLGTGAAWAILHYRLATPLTLAPVSLAAVVGLCLLVSWGIGFFAVWNALRAKAAPFLHNE